MIIEYTITDGDLYIEQCNFSSKTVFYSWKSRSEFCADDYTVAIFKIKLK